MAFMRLIIILYRLVCQTRYPALRPTPFIITLLWAPLSIEVGRGEVNPGIKTLMFMLYLRYLREHLKSFISIDSPYLKVFARLFTVYIL